MKRFVGVKEPKRQKQHRNTPDTQIHGPYPFQFVLTNNTIPGSQSTKGLPNMASDKHLSPFHDQPQNGLRGKCRVHGVPCGFFYLQRETRVVVLFSLGNNESPEP